MSIFELNIADETAYWFLLKVIKSPILTFVPNVAIT